MGTERSRVKLGFRSLESVVSRCGGKTCEVCYMTTPVKALRTGATRKLGRNLLLALEGVAEWSFVKDSFIFCFRLPFLSYSPLHPDKLLR
jgi:hypothetical protein